jgi:hypothetical protein
VVGKRFREAVRLASTAAGNWARIDGVYSGQGVNLLALPLCRLLNVILVWALEHQSSEDGQKWLDSLNGPLPGESKTAAIRDDFDDSFDQINQ